MLRYKILIGAILAVLPGYSGYWYVVAGKIETASANFATLAAAEGIAFRRAGKTVSGFPYRLILDYDQPSLTGPGWAWQAPRVEAFAQSYDLTRFIISAPGPHLVELTPPGGFPLKLSLAADSARASIDYTADSRLSQIDIDLQNVEFTDLLAASALQAGRLQAHMRRAPENDAAPGPAIDLAFKGEALTLPEQVKALLLDAPVSLLQITAVLRGLGDIEALGQLPDMIRAGSDIRLEITSADLVWGEVTVTASGALSLDDRHRPAGEIRLSITGQEEILDRLEQAGFIKPGTAGTARAILGSMAAMNNGRAMVSITLKDGVATAGLLRLGKLKPLF